MSLNRDEEMTMTYTSVLTKDGKPHIELAFQRGGDSCEGSIPEGRIHKNNGFSKEEVEALEQYLAEHKRQIIEQAKEISGFRKLFG